VGIAHNVKAFDLMFVLNSLVKMKTMPQLLIMNVQMILCLKVENLTSLDSLNYTIMPVRKKPKAFDLTA